MNKEECLRAQAAHNLPCFIHECPLHQTCLHWLTGQYYGSDFHVVTSVNPYYPNVNSLQCTLYQKDEIMTFPILLHVLLRNASSHSSRVSVSTSIAMAHVPFLQKTNSTLPVSSTKKVGMEKSATTIGKKITCGKKRHRFIWNFAHIIVPLQQ